MSAGQVKWFNNAKGFGFIVADDGGDDLFAHYSAINMEGYRTLKAGQRVAFDVGDGPKGRHAVNIRLSEPVPGGAGASRPPERAAAPDGEAAADIAARTPDDEAAADIAARTTDDEAAAAQAPP